MFYEYIFIYEATEMPGFDRTGPGGYGPATGRGMGPCGGGMAYGRGGRMGRGRGFGRGYCWNVAPSAPLSGEAQKELLEAELRRLEAQKIEVQRRLTDLS